MRDTFSRFIRKDFDVRNKKSSRRIYFSAGVATTGVVILFAFEAWILLGGYSVKPEVIENYAPWATPIYRQLLGENDESLARWNTVQPKKKRSDKSSKPKSLIPGLENSSSDEKKDSLVIEPIDDSVVAPISTNPPPIIIEIDENIPVG